MENDNRHENGEQESYIPLPEEKILHSFLYTLLARDEHKAIYTQRYKNCPGIVVAHEIFYIKKEYRKPYKGAAEKVLMEVFPSNSEFGRWSWSITRDEAKAMERYNKMTKLEDYARQKG
jgi:hypothetical protein